MASMYTQQDFDACFSDMASKMRDDVWETRQETPPQAYIHVSKPEWDDTKMNGIHFEAYILSDQIQDGNALVALHCEGGCPFQQQFMETMTERFQAEVKKSPDKWGQYEVCGPKGCSVFEVLVPFGDSDVGGVVSKVQSELVKLQESIAPIVDKTIAECKQAR